MWRAVMVATVMVAGGCGTVPGADVDGSGDAARDAVAPAVLWMPDDSPKPIGMEWLPLVEVRGQVGLGQCNPCVTESGHGCCGTDGWTGPVGCGNVQGYLMDCEQRAESPTGCGQDVVAGVRVCE